MSREELKKSQRSIRKHLVAGLAVAVERPPDAILTDVMMPRMSGDELVRSLRARPQLDSVPVLVLTARADDALRVQLLRAGAQDYLMKPFVVEEILPGSAVDGEKALRDYLRATGVSNLHPVGTCRMGRAVDDVVDPQLRVYGIDRLRVADASIMPSIVAGNTNAPSIMIGEKCAAMVREAAR